MPVPGYWIDTGDKTGHKYDGQNFGMRLRTPVVPANDGAMHAKSLWK